MTEAEWLASADPMKLVGRLVGVAGERRLRLAACGCCRLFRNRLYIPVALEALDLCERLAENPRDEALRSALTVAHQELLTFARHPHLVAEEGAALGAVAQAARPGTEPGPYRQDLCHAVIMLLEPSNRLRRTQLYRVLRDIFGAPFRYSNVSSDWCTDTVSALARQMYETRDFSALPILADALQDAGCGNDEVLAHCRGPGPHVRGCWVVDEVLGRT
jgi:hypothetical protein